MNMVWVKFVYYFDVDFCEFVVDVKCKILFVYEYGWIFFLDVLEKLG